MANMKLNFKLGQHLALTPQLAQAIKLLQTSRLELEQAINTELLENPVLEDISKINKDAKDSDNEENWEKYVKEREENPYSTPTDSALSVKKNDSSEFIEHVASETGNLSEHLLWQLGLENLTDVEKEFGANIIYNLTDDGYLNLSILDLLVQFKKENNIEFKEELACHILEIVQDFDPPGIASASVSDCLIKQLEQMDIDNNYIRIVIKEHLKNIENKQYAKICKDLDITEGELEDIISIIKSLEPKPGQMFSSSKVDINYIVPDVYVYKSGENYVINLNDDNIPDLQISGYYMNLMNKASSLDKEAKDYVVEKIKSAYSIIKGIAHRQTTLYNVTESIVNKQKDFFESGIHKLRPLILREVADEIKVHPSTVSRITTNKYIHTQHGLFELKFFFSNSVATNTAGLDLSAQAVKKIIKGMIEGEAMPPLSDSKIADVLKTKNIDIARRTVAKYRESMGILPSSKRKK